jgi:hypothetical protein
VLPLPTCQPPTTSSEDGQGGEAVDKSTSRVLASIVETRTVQQHHHLRQYFCNAVGSATDYYDITSSRIINNFVANYLVDDAGWGECSESRNRYRCNSHGGSLSGLIEINGRRERSVLRIAHSDLYCTAGCSQPRSRLQPAAGWLEACGNINNASRVVHSIMSTSPFRLAAQPANNYIG